METDDPSRSSGGDPAPPAGDGIGAVVAFAAARRGFRSAGYCVPVLERRVRERIAAAGAAGAADYLRLLASSLPELDLLVEALTVKVSAFFRDPLVFEYLNELVFPSLLARKAAEGNRSIRVWSAGCAGGEEPYSVAILLHELSRRETPPTDVTIFATDVDERALSRGREALYPESAVANVRLGLLSSSFRREGEAWRVAPEIARLVRFSVHDLLDGRTAAPAESIFGTFDLVLCRNVLIYFDPAAQAAAFSGLVRSLAEGGHLLLGQSESPPGPWRDRLRRVNDCCSLWVKPAAARDRGEPR